ncbi:MAG: ABC transporter substrate-binding protein [Candidatus Aminicenantes bacterium]|nr:ABC transporter substrate-binding protein [Candidatus Aminicenantes bacterium]
MICLLFSVLGAEQSVIYLRLADALTLDPGKFEDFYSQEVIANVFEGLVRLRPGSLVVEPCLAERWIFKENGKRWLFYLRRGVKFHNGKDFNARSVVYSFKKRMENMGGEYSAFGRVFPFISAVSAKDDWSVEIVLTRPYLSFLSSLVDFRADIIAPGSANGREFKPVGTGPFVLSEWVKGRSLVLRRNPLYWDTPARIDKVVFRSEKSASLRVAQIKNGSVQISMIRSAAEYSELAGKSDIGIISQPSMSTHYLAFNSLRPPFTQLKVRKAFSHLLNIKVLVRRVFQNLAVPADQFLPPAMTGTAPAIGGTNFSLQQARLLLKEAGLAKGFSCSLSYSEGQFGVEEIAKAIVAKAKLVNVMVKSIKLPFDQFFRVVQNGDSDLILMSWGYTADPIVFLNPMFMLVPSSGKMFSVSPAYAEILSKAEMTIDWKTREKYYAEAQRLIFSELPLLPLFHLNELVAYTKRVSWLRMDPLGFLLFKDAILNHE